jgi:hypothetical protein
MKKLLLLLMFIPVLHNAQTINFTDPVLKAKLLSASPDNNIAYGNGGYIKIDINNDMEIQLSEAAVIDSLNIQGMPGNVITNLAGLSGFVNLKKLDISDNAISDIQLNLPALRILHCSNSQVLTISPNDIPNLEILHCELNSMIELDLTVCTNLRELHCNYNNLTLLNISGLSNLTVVNCHWNALTSLSLSGTSALEDLRCSSNMLTTLDLSPNTGLKYLRCSGNSITTLTNLPSSLLELYCNDNELSALSQIDLPNLRILECASNNLTTLLFGGHQELTILRCDENQLVSLDVSGCAGLYELSCAANNLSVLPLIGIPNLHQVNAALNQLTEVIFQDVPQLAILQLDNNLLTSLDVSSLSLQQLYVGSNLLTDIAGINNSVHAIVLAINNNQFASLDISGLTSLVHLNCSNNLFSELNLSQNTSLQNLVCQNNPSLTYINIKNGINMGPAQNDNFSGNPSLFYICADEDEIQNLFQALTISGLSNVSVSSYCDFVPGGAYNTITGQILYDSQLDGCDPADQAFSYIKLNINTGTEDYYSFTDSMSAYTIFTNEGNFAITPQFENPTIFNVSPPAQSVSFAEPGNLVSVNNFCITPNGVHPDLEVIVSPIFPARPGFDAVYQITYKNKGNQIMSGEDGLHFSYDQNVQNLITTIPEAASSIPGSISWSFSDLKPFESRSILVVLNINAPTDSNPVNIGDVLTYTASIMPGADDDTIVDNLFLLDQVVVGSFDPNDITCLQGDNVDPSMIGEYLHYIVNFENTGTAAAENIVVKIEIYESSYDLESLQILFGSHPVTARIKGHVAEFIFSDIMLDSGGHGNILLKIRSSGALSVGDSVLKNAAIYFDYNFPVITNDAETTFQTLSRSENHQDDTIRIYPNPTSELAYISASGDVESLEVFDSSGRIVMTKVGNVKVINISSFSTGTYIVRIKTGNGSAVMKLIKS